MASSPPKAPPKSAPRAEPESPGSGPPPLAILDTEALRRQLAGLADPTATPGRLTPPVIRHLAIRFVTVLAALYNREDLDPLKLWERIGSALETADAKAGEDALRFASLALEHIQAEPGPAAASPALGAVLGTLDQAGDEDRGAFLAYLRTHRYPALAFARARWQQVKDREIEL